MPLLKKDPQAVGSVITYARRYGLCAAIGLASEDDDAEGGMARPASPPVPKSQSGTKGLASSAAIKDTTNKVPQRNCQNTTAKDLLIKRLYLRALQQRAGAWA